ncbi:hypothetical protein SAMN04488516_101313 [Desulfonauticus submarinus]|uniref:Uncharacterized protein n=1 Tax=Desulfonauticus submarinus TaxID=206665 RepID=A0A1H0A757_9BACT|nr:hypothetical protein [Desulfonauticus submarinus]SDN29582.1 hypothetical protein SAMN04488516_101313 [Desulfonauticus submarinus]
MKNFKFVIIFAFLLVCLFSCSISVKKESPFVQSSLVDSAYSYRIKFLNSFLEGKFCDAKIYFNKSNLIFATHDKVEMIGLNFYYLYRLYQYIGEERIRFYKCSEYYLGKKLSNFISSSKDLIYKRMVEQKKYHSLWLKINKEKNPIYISVYSRKVVECAPIKWKKKFLTLAFNIDKKYGWTLFLVEDWKLKKRFFSSKEADKHLEVLKSSLENCDFNDDLYYFK